MTIASCEPFFSFRERGQNLQDFYDVFDQNLSHRFVNGVSLRGDVTEKDSHYLVSFDIPGVDKEDIHIELFDKMLKVSGERKQEQSEHYYSEKNYGHFERMISMPTDFNGGDIQAHYDNGVLTIAIPKKEQVRPKSIPITQDRNSGVWGRFLNVVKKSS